MTGLKQQMLYVVHMGDCRGQVHHLGMLQANQVNSAWLSLCG